ncbi:MAG TPA: VCBS repeat-containing protein [Pirellulaceae bacterium]|nr:VCBS repeat-containing protein [Pirellulaceae bacterium]
MSPSPESFPKDAWYEEVERGYRFYFESGRKDLHPPPMIEAVHYFRSLAPERLLLPSRNIQGVAGTSNAKNRFRVENRDVALNDQLPAVAHLKFLSSGTESPQKMLLCDMRLGEIRQYDFGDAPPTLLAKLDNPCHIEPVDLDGDGRLDYVVADLGSFHPADHDDGRVVWLHPDAAGSGWTQQILHTGVGRVADVRPADFNEDGRIDLIVAVFGWHTTGKILLLTNATSNNGEVKFTASTVDTRHGASHVPVCDLNGDGHLDFIALISQEYETIIAFINDGTGAFERQTLSEARDPSDGSSGIELVDLDADGDLDILYTIGDSFDSMYLKPAHGVLWLENSGKFPFREHRLCNLPGAYRAVPGDMDGDGDLDIVASSFVPRDKLSGQAVSDMDSLVLLEQQAGHRFVRSQLESGNPRHATIGVADLDGDGDLDIVAGNYLSSTIDLRSRLTIWWNEG